MLAEGHQRELDFRRIILRALREIGTAEMRHAADCRQQVARLRQVQHLLHGHTSDHTLPAPHSLRLLGGQPFVGALLQAESREEVLAHQQMLQLRRLAQEKDQLFAALDHQWSCHANLPYHPPRVGRPAT
jgi:hypothetical protein